MKIILLTYLTLVNISFFMGFIRIYICPANIAFNVKTNIGILKFVLGEKLLHMMTQDIGFQAIYIYIYIYYIKREEEKKSNRQQ